MAPESPSALPETGAAALARLYDLDLVEDPGDSELYLALAGRTDGSIVELAVGTGRVAVPLASAGYRVTGVDHDPAMLARAAARASRADAGTLERLELVEGDLVDAQVPAAGHFGLAILALNSILLLAERGRQRRAIERMFTLLGSGGLAVVDTWLPTAEDLVRFDGRLSLEWLRTDPETGRVVTKLASAWYDAATRVVTLTTLFDESKPGQATVRWSRSDALRLIGADELESAAEDAGFQVEQLTGDYDLTPFGEGSERVILIARKPGSRGSP